MLMKTIVLSLLFFFVFVIQTFAIKILHPSGYTYKVGRAPSCLTIDKKGNVWVGCKRSIAKINPTGSIIGEYKVKPSIRQISLSASGYDIFALSNYNIIELNLSGKIIKRHRLPINAQYMAINGNGNIFVTSSNSIITELSPALKIVHTFYLKKRYFDGVIAISKSGDIYIANNTFKRHSSVIKLNPRGKIIAIYNLKGYYWPLNLAIDDSRDIWIGSSWTSWIKHEVSHNTLTELNKYGHKISEYNLNPKNPIENILIDQYGNILVLTNTILYKLNSRGKIINKYSVQNNVLGMAIGSSGDIWISNFKRGTVTKYVKLDKK